MFKTNTNIGLIAVQYFHHIGVIVKDPSRAYDFLSSIWGIWPQEREWEVGPREPVHLVASQDEVKAGGPINIKYIWAKAGPALVDIIWPLEDDGSVWSEFLKTHGEGIHHFALRVPNWEETVSLLQEKGAIMITGGIVLGKNWCYLDTPGSFVIEIMEK